MGLSESATASSSKRGGQKPAGAKASAMTVLGLAVVGASSALIPSQAASAAGLPRTASTPLPQASDDVQAIADEEQTLSAVPQMSAPVPASSVQAITVSHVVREGETIWNLAKSYQVAPDDIVRNNGIEADSLRVGQVISISTTERKRQIPKSAPNFPSASSKAIAPTRNLAQLQVQQAATSLAIGTPESGAAELQALQKKGPYLPVSPKAGESLEQRAEAASGLDEASATAGLLSNASTEIQLADSASRASEVEGVQDPEQPDLAKSEQLVADSSVISALPSASQGNSSLQPGVHRIGLGETVSTIARAYGISAQELIELNNIRNPNRIFVGQTLKVPAVQPPEVTPPSSAPSEAVRLAAALPISLPASEAPELPEAARNAAEPAAPVEPAELVETPEAEVPQADVSIQGDSEETATLPEPEAAIAAANPYAEDLISDIEDIADDEIAGEEIAGEEIAGEEIAASTISDPSAEASPDEADTGVSALADLDDANPEFVAARATGDDASFRSESGQSVTTVSEPTVSEPTASEPTASEPAASEEQSTLVASAPLGAENYVPLAEPVTGRMVSPELPQTSNPEDHLPGVSAPISGYVWPARGLLTSGYGWRWGRMHKGIDVAAPVGTPVIAAAPGVVEFSGWNSGGYGNMVDIRHPDGNKTRYAHNSRNLVRVGQKVDQGEQIAEMGSTGYSTGPHVHFEIHIPDQGAINPVVMLSER
ncbi:MAG: peptidoglycan DD-metalloendopeptidase family protein [Elainellaceae cyanobacterium]